MEVQPIRELLDRVRARWRRLIVLQAAGRGALAVSAVLATAWILSHWALRVPIAAAALAVVVMAAAAAAAAWALWPAREVPSDLRVARFIEESRPELDDRLVSAVDVARRPADWSPLAAAMLTDAVRAASAVDPATVVPAPRLRRAGFQAVAAALLLAMVGVGSHDAASASLDALSSTMFTSRATPDARVPAGSPPRVTHIDLEYLFPAALRLAPRTEQDGGDIYAPAGTEVRFRVHVEPEASAGRMTLADGKTIPLQAEGPALLTGAFTVMQDSSYRIALSGRDGLTSPGDTEYFIRMLEDRPPEVHIMKPARDRSATPLEEVDIEARAVDDFGIESLDLVYAVNGGREKAARLDIPRQANAVAGRYTLPLEDLGVRPGDFVTYYARARDLARGKPSSEARSDIFFLEVKPFDQGVARAAEESDAAGSGDPRIDDLVAAQKDVIVATWKIDRRTEASGSQSADDVRSVSRAEAALKTRVEQTASSFRESQMRNPRQAIGAPPPPRAGQTTGDEDDMAAAASAMGKAVASLNELKTGAALPPEMEALSRLLSAQAGVKERQVAARQNAGGNGSNRSNVDMSSRFDKELQRHEQTNYETRPERDDREGDTELDKVKDLARRQDELNQRQQDLGRDRNRMTAEELKRQLETLTREQSDLRQQTEELARQLSQPPDQSGRQNSPSNAQSQQGASGQEPAGSPSAGGRQGRQGRAGGQQAQSGQPGGQQEQQMRAASDAMRQAASDLRQQNPERAAEQGAQAVGQLRELERQLEARGPQSDADESKRLAGDQARAEALSDRIQALSSQLEQAASPDKTQAGATPGDLRELEQEYTRQLEQARALLEQVRREDPNMDQGDQGAAGFTFEGQGTTLSAPGTEAFKQDVAKWRQLSQQATAALDRAASAIAGRRLARDSRDRLASGADDRPPAAYESQVDSYFKALSTRKKP